MAIDWNKVRKNLSGESSASNTSKSNINWDKIKSNLGVQKKVTPPVITSTDKNINPLDKRAFDTSAQSNYQSFIKLGFTPQEAQKASQQAYGQITPMKTINLPGGYQAKAESYYGKGNIQTPRSDYSNAEISKQQGIKPKNLLGKLKVEIDHLAPKALGGTETSSNLKAVKAKTGILGLNKPFKTTTEMSPDERQGGGVAFEDRVIQDYKDGKIDQMDALMVLKKFKDERDGMKEPKNFIEKAAFKSAKGETLEAPKLNLESTEWANKPKTSPYQGGNRMEVAKTVDKFVNTGSETLTDLANRLAEMVNTLDDKHTKAEKAASIGRAGMGLLNTAFLPATAPLVAAEELSITRIPAKVINTTFQKFGEAGAEMTGVWEQGLLKAGVDKNTIETLRPLREEAGALLGQVVLGTGVKMAVDKVKGTTKTESQTKIVDNAKLDPKLVEGRLNDVAQKLTTLEKLDPKIGEQIKAIPVEIDSPGKFYSEVAKVLKENKVWNEQTKLYVKQTMGDFKMLLSEEQPLYKYTPEEIQKVKPIIEALDEHINKNVKELVDNQIPINSKTAELAIDKAVKDVHNDIEIAKTYKELKGETKTTQIKQNLEYQGTGAGNLRKTNDYEIRSHNIPEEIIKNSNGNITENTKTILSKIKDKPNAEVTIYRAAPKDSGINNGDWVALDRGVAESFTHTKLGTPIKNIEVQELKVKAKDIAPQKSAGGKRIYDFAYMPEKVKTVEIDPLIQEAKPLSQYNRYKDTILSSQRTEKGLLSKIYTEQKFRANKKSLNLDYTKEELGKFINDNEKYKDLYNNWVKSDYDSMLKPSIDRLNPKKGYSLDNIQLTTWGENKLKGHKERNITQGKPIIQLDKDNNIIKMYTSLTDASINTGINFKTISNAALKTPGNKTAGGYDWRYATKEEISKSDIWNKANKETVKEPPILIEKKAIGKTPQDRIQEKVTPQTPEIKEFKSRVYERLQNEIPEKLREDVSVNRIKQESDISKAVDLIATNKNKAYEIAMGMREAPKDQTATAINISMAEKALDEGNYKLYSQLTKNRSLAQTRRGQEIVAEKSSITDNSTSRYVKELINAKLNELGNKYLSRLNLKKKSNKENALEVIDKEVKKAQSKIKEKRMDLAEAQKLIDSLVC